MSGQKFRLAVVGQLNALMQSLRKESLIPPIGSDTAVVETLVEHIFLSSAESTPHIARQCHVDRRDRWALHDSQSIGAHATAHAS
jgi:hypothetical protein